MLIETQVVRSESELLKELQGLPITKAVTYRNADRKAWEQIVKELGGVSVAVVLTFYYQNYLSTSGCCQFACASRPSSSKDSSTPG